MQNSELGALGGSMRDEYGGAPAAGSRCLGGDTDAGQTGGLNPFCREVRPSDGGSKRGDHAGAVLLVRTSAIMPPGTDPAAPHQSRGPGGLQEVGPRGCRGGIHAPQILRAHRDGDDTPLSPKMTVTTAEAQARVRGAESPLEGRCGCMCSEGRVTENKRRSR